MFGIRRIKQQIEDIKQYRQKVLEETFVPVEELPEFDEKEIHTDQLRSMYDPSSLVYLDHSKLIDPSVNLYYYNAGFYEDTPNTYRMFYRCGKNPKAFEDRVATCLLDKKFNILPDTNKYLNLHSSWEETTNGDIKLKKLIPYMFKNGTHVEDPRALRVGDNWFIFYTDGIHMAVAKLTKDCDLIYSHYLHTPDDTLHADSDGREKNWVPIKASDGFLYVLYSESPRILFKYIDEGSFLKLIQQRILYYDLGWSYGYVRGGCPPVPYKDDKYIWFFHSAMTIPTYISEKSRVYMIGAYITEDTYPYKTTEITALPVLIGWPSHAIKTLIIQDNVVFPCGAVQKDSDTYVICMGVNDYKIAYIEVKISDLIWKTAPKFIKLSSFSHSF